MLQKYSGKDDNNKESNLWGGSQSSAVVPENEEAVVQDTAPKHMMV